jgi:hypothetical protein
MEHWRSELEGALKQAPEDDDDEFEQNLLLVRETLVVVAMVKG